MKKDVHNKEYILTKDSPLYKMLVKAVDPLQPIRDWMEANPENARIYGQNNYIY